MSENLELVRSIYPARQRGFDWIKTTMEAFLDAEPHALRFMADGRRRYQTLGTAEKGWTRARAETERTSLSFPPSAAGR